MYICINICKHIIAGGIETEVNTKRIKKKIMNFRQGCQHTWKAENL